MEYESISDTGAVERVYLGIMQALEDQSMSPGQRLVDADLSKRFGVGRNAVREALQRLATRGVIDLNRYRSASIRELDLAETMEILTVAAEVTALAAQLAAAHFDLAAHRETLMSVMGQLADDVAMRDPAKFSQARRGFYRTLLAIGGNRELQRLFPAVGIHMVYSQYRSQRLTDIRLADYQSIGSAILANDAHEAGLRARAHVERARAAIQEIAKPG
ncbi:MAG: GntR family transcriptional regulator [Bradyrhizobium sp.]|nr:GntR family transcriptional regulator [Bradyrhizobium sp.]